MRVDGAACVGADRERDAALIREAYCGDHLVPGGRDPVAALGGVTDERPVLSDVVVDPEREHETRVGMGREQIDRGIVDKRGVMDRVEAAPYRRADRLGPLGMCGGREP